MRKTGTGYGPFSRWYGALLENPRHLEAELKRWEVGSGAHDHLHTHKQKGLPP